MTTFYLPEPMLDPALVSLETLAQPVELWPVRRQPDAEHRDTRRSPRLTTPLRARRRVWRRAPAVCNRARAPVDLARVRHDDAREEERSDDDVLVLGRDHVGRHRGLQRAENGDGQDDADDRAAAAEDRDAAEQDDRHHEQLEPILSRSGPTQSGASSTPARPHIIPERTKMNLIRLTRIPE